MDRADLDDATLRKRLWDGAKRFARAGKPQDWRKFAAHISYCRGDFENSKTYRDLVRRLAELDKDWNAKATRIFHLAAPPSLFGKIPKLLADAGLARDCRVPHRAFPPEAAPDFRPVRLIISIQPYEAS